MNPRYFIDTIYLSNVKKKTKPCKKEIIKQIKKYNKPEIDICEKIKKIPYYFCFFSPILEYNLLDRVDSYIIVSLEEKLIPFHDFFKKINKNEKIVHILSSYRHLVEGIQKLNTIGILYGNYESIGFNYQNQPIMFNFERKSNKNTIFANRSPYYLIFKQKTIINLYQYPILERYVIIFPPPSLKHQVMNPMK